MAGLPIMPNKDRIRKSRTVKFGGLEHNRSASDGAIYDMRNMASDDYPIISTRKERHFIKAVATPHGMLSHDALYYVSGTSLCCLDGDTDVVITTVSDSDKVMAALGSYLLIWPDKIYYNRDTGESGSLDATFTGTASIGNGTFAGEEAELNTVTFTGSPNLTSKFKVGDGVTLKISGEDDMSAIIREITATKLVFYENTFTESKSSVSVTVSRNVPDLDFICTNENRVWGCKGDRIYASKLGDPFNWEVFDGISTDSWQVDVGSAGDFTACISFRGYPTFFKEECIYKVYGSKPANFQVMSSASLGVREGASRSLAVAGEVLFYLSRAGIVAYSGGIPQNISAPLGDVDLVDTVAGSDGRKYYLGATDKRSGDYAVWVYDTVPNLWHVETSPKIKYAEWHDGIYFLTVGGEMWVIGGTSLPDSATEEDELESYIEFGDFYENDPNKKGTSKLQIRAEVGAGSSLRVEIMYDSDGIWNKVGTLLTPVKRSYYLPVIPRRSDHFRIRLVGRGSWTLYSLVRESYSGSEL